MAGQRSVGASALARSRSAALSTPATAPRRFARGVHTRGFTCSRTRDLQGGADDDARGDRRDDRPHQPARSGGRLPGDRADDDGAEQQIELLAAVQPTHTCRRAPS